MSLPYVILKSAMSIDGYIDDSSGERLLLSNEADFERLDQVRSECDAILVGAGTLRTDNPSLLIKSSERQKYRVERKLSAEPMKVTVTLSGSLSQESRFFTTGEGKKMVYCPKNLADKLMSELAGRPSTDICGLENLSLEAILNDLAERGIKKLLVEGGTRIATSFLAANLVDELQVTIAPFFVADAKAPRLSNPQSYPHSPKNPMHLSKLEQLGDVVLLTYMLTRDSNRKLRNDHPP